MQHPLQRPPRRRVLQLGLAGVAAAWLRPAAATPESMAAAIAAFTGGRTPQEGRVVLDIAPLVENGNVVPVAVSVQSPMTAADHVQRIAVFTPLNPQTEVAVFHLGPASGAVDGRVRVSTRMRMASTQPVTAVAVMSDGSAWLQRVQVVVTLAACIEGESE